ncbi:hypothetical protein J4444_00170 [Candidatus Woesearchaeota archaeon]|nr:hypothetical protein [Candidatus Woesearchaeota archaeon]
MSLSKSTSLKFYKRKDVQDALVAHAQSKEIGMRFNESFGKRPDTLTYPRDVLELALQGVTSFHASEELWSNPLSLLSSNTKQDLDKLRIGWDLLLDIDCKIMEYSRISADLIVKFLQYHGVKDISVKFSGNKGFHIGVPFEAFPQKLGNENTKDLFPEAPRRVASYIKESIKETLGKRILEFEKGNISAVQEKVGLPREEITRYEKNEWGDNVAKLQVDGFLEIDTVLLASRHLYRMPYSLHEKSGLVSMPIDPNKVLEFEKSMADPEKIVNIIPFMERNVSGESGRQLLREAWDYQRKMPIEKEIKKEGKQFEETIITSPISEDFFPPCIKAMLNGMEDGKKRAVFCLMNYLGKLGWSKPDIEAYLMKWNQEKNKPPLREVYIKGQMAHFKPGERLPPNCDNDAYYPSMNVVCKPNNHCQKFKNPVNYTLYRWKRHMQDKQEEEEKENRKRGRKKKEGKVSDDKNNNSTVKIIPNL